MRVDTPAYPPGRTRYPQDPTIRRSCGSLRPSMRRQAGGVADDDLDCGGERELRVAIGDRGVDERLRRVRIGPRERRLRAHQLEDGVNVALDRRRVLAAGQLL